MGCSFLNLLLSDLDPDVIATLHLVTFAFALTCHVNIPIPILRLVLHYFGLILTAKYRH